MFSDDLKIILKGAVGSLTFGAYHMYLTINMINENNRSIQLKPRKFYYYSVSSYRESILPYFSVEFKSNIDYHK